MLCWRTIFDAKMRHGASKLGDRLSGEVGYDEYNVCRRRMAANVCIIIRFHSTTESASASKTECGTFHADICGGAIVMFVDGSYPASGITRSTDTADAGVVFDRYS